MTRPHIARRVALRRTANDTWPLPPGTFKGLDEKVVRLDLLTKSAARFLEEAHLSHLFVDHANPNLHADSVLEVKDHLKTLADVLSGLVKVAEDVRGEVGRALAKVHAAYP